MKFEDEMKRRSAAQMKKLLTSAKKLQPQQQHLPFVPLTIRGRTMRNRVIKAATYEALCDINGVPLQGMVDFHRKMSAGGVGMSIVAYGAVSAGGRSFPA